MAGNTSRNVRTSCTHLLHMIAMSTTQQLLCHCHGLCTVTFFPKNNQRMALTESPMMATSPLFSATITTRHRRWTHIRALSEYFLHSDTTNKPTFLSLPLPTSTMCYLPQHNQSPTMLHTRSMSQANHITHAPVLCYDFDRFRLYSRDRSQSVSDNAQAYVQGAS